MTGTPDAPNNQRTLVPGWTDQDLEGTTTDRFERVAAAIPDAVALVGERGEVLTFEELREASSRLAGAILDRLGAGVENVALYAPPGADSVVAMLAILAAGKAYLPLDPVESATRARAKIANGEARLVVTAARHEDEAASLVEADGTVLLWNDPPAGGSWAPPQVHADSRFNLIYTSGSTGTPKGVVQTHRNVLFDTAATFEIMHIDERDRFGLVVPLTFGASVSDVMGALLNGASLHVLDLRVNGIDEMAWWMKRHAITITHLVPTVFRRWMASLDEGEQYPAMRMIKVGGEPVLPRDLDAFAEHFGDGCVLRNGLGTTETYLVAAEVFTTKDREEGTVVPIGHPVTGRSVAIVGPDGRELPGGEIGQIAVTSRYLSPGYWKDQAATDRVFSVSPDGDGDRTYLTGDLGRIRPDGRLEHLGRIDDMVKIRGQRVDLAEVEAAMLDQPGVAEATVLAEEGPRGDNQLVAYAVPVAEAPTAADLRAGLASSLPAFMIPARFVWLEQMPTLSFGKIDRRSLRQLEIGSAPLDESHVEPRDADEAFIASCAAAILGVERIGVHDDLFELGLDSLSGASLVGRINEGRGTALPIEAVFASPTIAGLATYATSGTERGEGDDIGILLDELHDLDEEVARKMVDGGRG